MTSDDEQRCSQPNVDEIRYKSKGGIKHCSTKAPLLGTKANREAQRRRERRGRDKKRKKGGKRKKRGGK